MRPRIVPVCALLLAAPAGAGALADDTHALYLRHCAECHGADRLGRIGPALLPQNLGRLAQGAAVSVLRDGRPATQMPAFGDKLDPEQMRRLVELIYTPLPAVPDWGMEEIAASRILHPADEPPSDRPVFEADVENLFVVVELGDHHATLLDGDRFEPIHRFPTRFALHGGPKFAAGGRYLYLASRDGWISKYDIFNLAYVAEVRAGINTRNLAVSHDGRLVAVANYLPHTLVILDARDLRPLRVLPVQDREGRSSRVSAVYTAAPRSSFLVALKDLAEVWEISYRPPPRPDPGVRARDCPGAAGDGCPPASFPIRRIEVAGILDDFFIDQSYARIAGSSRDGGGQVVDLDLGRAASAPGLAGLPHLSSAITWPWKGRVLLATPNIEEPKVSILDTATWELVTEIPTLGPGFFMRSHEGSRYAWVDVFFGENRDAMHVIDKRTLKLVKTLRPAPGKTSAHVEFTKDGRYALVSVWDTEGALVVYDAVTLEEVARLPMKKPSGKYNVHNKLTLSRGTSH